MNLISPVTHRLVLFKKVLISIKLLMIVQISFETLRRSFVSFCLGCLGEGKFVFKILTLTSLCFTNLYLQRGVANVH